MRYIILFLTLAPLAAAETFPSVLVKPAWPDRKGTLEIGGQGITFTPQAESKAPAWFGRHRARRLSWKWLDIQYFDRISEKEFLIVTYQGDWRLPGRDKRFLFRIVKGELNEALFETISRSLNRPLTNRVPPRQIAAAYSIPVRREHTFGGTEGQLEFTAGTIYYITKQDQDSRVWQMDRDVSSVWSGDPYQLEVRVYEGGRRDIGRTVTYTFDLKEKLDASFYRELVLKLYRLEANNQVIR